MRVLFESKNLIGDALYIGPALRAWIKSRKSSIVQDEIYLSTLNDHITSLYQGMVRDMVRLNIVFERPAGHFDFEHVFNVNKAFALSDKRKQHIAQSYADLLGVGIGAGPDGDGYASYKPIYIPVMDSITGAALDELRGCILVSMFSASCASRGNPPQPANKMLPFPKWKPMLKLLQDTYPRAPIRFLGAPTDRIPDELKDYVYSEAMFGIPLNRLALIMREAKLLVTIDNGMGHLAATQDTPTFLMYPRCLGAHYILPIGNKNLLTWVHMDPMSVSPTQLRHGLQYAIQKLEALKK